MHKWIMGNLNPHTWFRTEDPIGLKQSIVICFSRYLLTGRYLMFSGNNKQKFFGNVNYQSKNFSVCHQLVII